MSRTRPNPSSRSRTQGKGPRHPGAVKLSEVAAEKVGVQAENIVNSLIDSTQKGNATSATVLMSIVDGADWTDNAEATRRVVTLIDLLERDDEGLREPEN